MGQQTQKIDGFAHFAADILQKINCIFLISIKKYVQQFYIFF